MKLTIIEHTVQKVCFGSVSKFENGVLTLQTQALTEATLNHVKGSYTVAFQLALPGESKRIVHIADTIKPACKEKGAAFPGWSSAEGSGEGVTHQIANLAIMQSIVSPGIQEGIVDMSGLGAQYSLFSKLINLVMVIAVKEPKEEKQIFADDLIRMNVQAAEYVASLTMGCRENTAEKTFELQQTQADLPRIGYAYFIQAQGPLRDVRVRAKSGTSWKPELIHPNLILDGAIVSGNYIIACQKNPTWFHQENPIIREAYAMDGKSLSFAGVILSTESSLLDGKRENAKQIAQIAKEHRLDGIVVTQEGGGHADVDLMMTCDACEAEGIRTVLLTNEIAGPGGDLPPLVSYSQKADAMVSTGNNDETIDLPEMDEAVGGTSILNGAFPATGKIHTSLGIMYTATNQLGANKMTALAF